MAFKRAWVQFPPAPPRILRGYPVSWMTSFLLEKLPMYPFFQGAPGPWESRVYPEIEKGNPFNLRGNLA
jgi:hypothetical protein